MKNYYRQGEILITPTDKIEGEKLNHLVLAEGEATNHMHEIVEGKATLYQAGLFMCLSVTSKEAKLAHPDHNTVTLPKGKYKIRIQKEYQPGEEKYRNVMD